MFWYVQTFWAPGGSGGPSQNAFIPTFLLTVALSGFDFGRVLSCANLKIISTTILFLPIRSVCVPPSAVRRSQRKRHLPFSRSESTESLRSFSSLHLFLLLLAPALCPSLRIFARNHNSLFRLPYHLRMCQSTVWPMHPYFIMPSESCRAAHQATLLVSRLDLGT